MSTTTYKRGEKVSLVAGWYKRIGYKYAIFLELHPSGKSCRVEIGQCEGKDLVPATIRLSSIQKIPEQSHTSTISIDRKKYKKLQSDFEEMSQKFKEMKVAFDALGTNSS